MPAGESRPHKNGLNDFRDLSSEQRWYGVADLDILGCSGSAKEIIVRERLNPCGFTNGEASALSGVVMNVVMTVFRYMAGYRGCRPVPHLDSKPVGEQIAFQGISSILVARQEFVGKLA